MKGYILVPRCYMFPKRIYKVYLVGSEKVPCIFVSQPWGIETWTLRELDICGHGYYAFKKPYNGGVYND